MAILDFDCRFCTEDVCQKLFDPRKPSGRRKSQRGKGRNVSNFQPRSDETARQIALQWEQYVHPRGRDFFLSQDQLIETLTMIAKSINSAEDPILVSFSSSLLLLSSLGW